RSARRSPMKVTASGCARTSPATVRALRPISSYRASCRLSTTSSPIAHSIATEDTPRTTGGADRCRDNDQFGGTSAALALLAFVIGSRLAGPIGGAWAAVLSGLHPVFLERSIGSDNDVWNVVMPLYLIWAGIAALQATSRARAVVLAGLAALAAAVHAQVW